jgi:tripartite-type tricarboxylate transporter receptor subunit TctC
MQKRTLLAAALGAALLHAPGHAGAQPAFPAKAVTMVVPFAAGGPTDVLARALTEALTRELGQTVVVENVTGAGGTIGAGRVAGARPDGYTLLLGNIGLATSGALYRRLPYNPAQAFEPIGLVSPVPMTLVARPDLPVQDLPGLVAWAREKGADVNLAHAGIGSASHLCATLLRSITRIPMTAVAFRGTAPVMTEMLAGRIDLTCDQTTNAMPYIQEGRVRALAVTTTGRLPVLPDVPTTAEGGLPALQVTIWHGLYAPKGTPQPAVERLSQALQGALRDKRVGQRLAELGSTPEPQERATPEAHRAMLDAEIARWRPILQAAGEFAD